MKKYVLCLLLLLTIFVSGCSKSSLSKISIDELKTKMKNGETFVLYFESDDKTLEKKINKILGNYNLKGYKINASKLDDQQKLNLKLNIDYEEPSIVFIINGQDPTKLSHITNTSMTTKEIEQRLKDMNFIK